VAMERSSYAILCLILDDGPQRLGTIASSFALDPSTITRQVQAVVNLGLAEKVPDPSDGRASLLQLTPEGRTAIETVRKQRRHLLDLITEDWTADERAGFLRALRRFNAKVDDWVVHGVPGED
jgi:DNA-binding MarR family transcriptional regulator